MKCITKLVIRFMVHKISHGKETYCNYDTLKDVQFLSTCFQCDQMTRLFVQYLAIYNNKNLPSSIKFAKVGSKFCTNKKLVTPKMPKT